jgi:hypothetical protein
MSKVIAISSREHFLAQSGKDRKYPLDIRTTADYRRMLSELRLRPPSQRAFLRKLLTRAMPMAPKQFPVATHVVHPAEPS